MSDKRLERAVRLFATALEQEGIKLDQPCQVDCITGEHSQFAGYCGETNRCLLAQLLRTGVAS